MPALGCTRIGKSRPTSKSGEISSKFTRERATQISLQTATDSEISDISARRSRALTLDSGTDAEDVYEQNIQLWICPSKALDWNRLSIANVKSRIILPDTFNPTRVTFATARERAHDDVRAAV
jgi:hypothetical protein